MTTETRYLQSLHNILTRLRDNANAVRVSPYFAAQAEAYAYAAHLLKLAQQAASRGLSEVDFSLLVVEDLQAQKDPGTTGEAQAPEPRPPHEHIWERCEAGGPLICVGCNASWAEEGEEGL